MAFDFQNINLIPKKCIVGSRSECDTRLTITKGTNSYKFELPIIPANMECVINKDVAKTLARHDYLYSMHRFGNTFEFAKSMVGDGLYLSISIGVNEDSRELLIKLKNANLIPTIITIDIAHGHAIKMKAMLEYTRTLFPFTIFIAGNVSTPQAVRDLEEWGADIIKVGIGPGSACTTYTATGFGSRGCQASVIFECSKARRNPNTLICADGGIREEGDIAKCLALGADLVMVGGAMSGFTDSPGNTVTLHGKTYKEFWGSASHYQSNKSSRIEGTKKLIEMKNMTLIQYMNYLKECLQSSISYGGGKDLSAFKSVEWIQKSQ
jgi:GMP reductase